MENITTIDEYNTFFDRYKQDKTIDINEIEPLLEKFEEYLNSILHQNYWFRNTYVKITAKELEDTITILTKYMNIIHDYYARISHEIISYNIDINYHFVDMMTTSIIILYSYIYHYNIFEVKKHNIMDVIAKSYGDILIFFMKRIIDKCYIISSKSIKKEELMFKFKDIIYTNEPNCLKVVKSQTRLVIDFINKISVFYKIQPSNTRYITMPKYTGICWFVSFIVGITYSDKNKKLLLDKYAKNQKNIEKDKDISQLSSKQIFTTLIYRIIKEITETNKTYNNIDKITMDELNIYLKKTPIQCLIKLINDYYNTEDKTILPHEYSFIKEYLDNPYIYYKPYNLDDYEKLGMVGIDGYNYFFLNLLYRFLNINSLYLIKAENNTYTYDTDNKDPDVIIINARTNKYSGERFMSSHINSNPSITYTDITSNITYNEPEQHITYNDNKYEIDYILFGSDMQNSWKNTGHAIVALSYEKEEYFYDSRYFINEYIYKDITLRYPCPLLKKQWKNVYYKKQNNFCIKKCFYTDINVQSKLYSTTRDFTQDNICYTSNNDIICCYVKVSDEITGGNKDYKITNNKVEFQYKNKKYT